MPSCSRQPRFLAALPPKGWCRNDEVCGRRLAILFPEQRQTGTTDECAKIKSTPNFVSAILFLV